MTLQMNSVNSTSISAIGYKYRTMKVVFNNGKTYEFKKVPREHFDRFCSSNSKGKFFNREIKAAFPYKELM